MNDGQFPNVVHGSHANGGEMKYKCLSSSVDYEKVISHFNGRGFWFSVKEDGSHLGYVEEWDRDEDRIYYDYFVLADLYERYIKETA